MALSNPENCTLRLCIITCFRMMCESLMRLSDVLDLYVLEDIVATKLNGMVNFLALQRVDMHAAWPTREGEHSLLNHYVKFKHRHAYSIPPSLLQTGIQEPLSDLNMLTESPPSKENIRCCFYVFWFHHQIRFHHQIAGGTFRFHYKMVGYVDVAVRKGSIQTSWLCSHVIHLFVAIAPIASVCK